MTSMAAQSLLLFPVDKEECLAFAKIAKSLGLRAVAASSVSHATVDPTYDAFVRLPYVTEASFDRAFDAALREHGITHVFSSHHAVWAHLDRRPADSARPGFTLCRPRPEDAIAGQFVPSFQFARRLQRDALSVPVAAGRPALESAFYAGLHQVFRSIPGESDDNKLELLCDLFRLIPDGDALEIGSLYGRTAVSMAQLARAYGTGNVISVDPWRNADLRSQGALATLADLSANTIDFDYVFEIFHCHAALADNIGFIRAMSDDAYETYRSAVRAGRLDSPGLGSLRPSPALALLHVDGNHEYAQVKRDIAHWSPHLAPGGWLLIDDYVWPFGAGPRQAGDEALSTGRYDAAFCCGDTLCLRRSPGVASDEQGARPSAGALR